MEQLAHSTQNQQRGAQRHAAPGGPVRRSVALRLCAPAGAIVPANCDPAVRLNRLRATATASLHGEAWQGKGPALNEIVGRPGMLRRPANEFSSVPKAASEANLFFFLSVRAHRRRAKSSSQKLVYPAGFLAQSALQTHEIVPPPGRLLVASAQRVRVDVRRHPESLGRNHF